MRHSANINYGDNVRLAVVSRGLQEKTTARSAKLLPAMDIVSSPSYLTSPWYGAKEEARHTLQQHGPQQQEQQITKERAESIERLIRLYGEVKKA